MALDKAFDPSLWADGEHLQPKQGGQAFDAGKQAVQTLAEIQKQTKTPDWLNTLLRHTSDAIVQSLRNVATIAIAETTGPGVDQKKLAEARGELAKGDTSTKPDDAIVHYKNAWNKALDARP